MLPGFFVGFCWELKAFSFNFRIANPEERVVILLKPYILN